MLNGIFHKSKFIIFISVVIFLYQVARSLIEMLKLCSVCFELFSCWSS